MDAWGLIKRPRFSPASYKNYIPRFIYLPIHMINKRDDSPSRVVGHSTMSPNIIKHRDQRRAQREVEFSVHVVLFQ